MSPTLAVLTTDGVVATLAYAVVGAILLFAGTWVVDLATPGPLMERLRDGSANAAAIIVANLAAVAAIVFAAALTSPDDLRDGLTSMVGYGGIGILAQAVLLLVIDHLLGIDFDELLRARALAPAGVVVAAASVALGTVMVVAVV